MTFSGQEKSQSLASTATEGCPARGVHHISSYTARGTHCKLYFRKPISVATLPGDFKIPLFNF